MVIPWVLWKLKLHQPIHRSFSSHGMYQVQFHSYAACLEIFTPFSDDCLSQLLPFFCTTVAQYIFLSRHRTAVPLSPFLAISFKISKCGISHLRVFLQVFWAGTFSRSSNSVHKKWDMRTFFAPVDTELSSESW